MSFYDDAKRWWKSKTVWFSSALVVLGTVMQYVDQSSAILVPYFGKWGGIATVAIGVINILLRLRTSRPIGKPTPYVSDGTYVEKG